MVREQCYDREICLKPMQCGRWGWCIVNPLAPSALFSEHLTPTKIVEIHNFCLGVLVLARNRIGADTTVHPSLS